MSIKTVRVYDIQAEEPDELDLYLYSIAADNSGSQYIFAEGKEVEGLDQKRIAENAVRIFGEESPVLDYEWISAAAPTMAMMFDGPEYETMDEAVEAEKTFANEAALERADFEDSDDEEDSLLVDEDEEDIPEETK